MRYRSDEQRRQATHAVAAALVLGFSLLFLSYLLYRLNISTFARRLDPILHAFNTVGLTGLATVNVGLPGHILAIWGVATLVSAAVLCRTKDDVYRRVVLYGGCLCVCYFWQEFFSLMEPRHIPIYYAGPCLALGFYLLLRHPAGLAARLMSGTALAVTLAGALAFSVYYNHPNLNPVLGPKVDVTLPKLTGLRESPERADTLLRLFEAFDSYGCRGRTFVTLHGTPILYYLFDVEPPRGLEYVYVPYIFNPNRVLQTLEQSRSWCVFVSWNWLDWPTPGSKPGTEPVMEYLRQYSKQIVRLSPRARPVHAYDDFVLYLGPRTLTEQARRSAPERK